jgi:EAL domain-containing protein (putative c-di-GMP-specific phosphodiesterase class I)
MATVQAAVELYASFSQEHTVLRRKVEDGQLHIDPLTGLASRLAVMEALETAAGALTDSSAALVAYFIDVGRWDDAAISRDDAQGDVLPKILAARLRQYCAGASVIARWSIGQFVVLLASHGVSDLDLYVWGEQLLQVLAEPIVLDQDRVVLAVTVGIARLVERLQWRALIQCAAMAAREGRRDGAPRVCLYRPEVPLQAERERDLLRALRQTLDLGGLHLHYQPIVDVSVGRVRAVECLARWEHKDLGPIAPATFIALAERNGEIERLGEWVLVRALNETNPFISRGAPTLAINVSATQIMAPGFLPHLERCLAQNELPPNTLELELTESALAGNVETLRDLLVAIRRLKVRIAVDDFGTGYSSLSYLSRLPIDLIKVDRVFVRDFAKGGKTIIKAALTIARDFGQEVIIEGVETEEMLEQVRELGVSLIQGFWFAKPMAPEEIAIWIRNFEQRAAEVRNVSPS